MLIQKNKIKLFLNLDILIVRDITNYARLTFNQDFKWTQLKVLDHFSTKIINQFHWHMILFNDNDLTKNDSFLLRLKKDKVWNNQFPKSYE